VVSTAEAYDGLVENKGYVVWLVTASPLPLNFPSRFVVRFSSTSPFSSVELFALCSKCRAKRRAKNAEQRTQSKERRAKNEERKTQSEERRTQCIGHPSIPDMLSLVQKVD
jgi:hypothetical protein